MLYNNGEREITWLPFSFMRESAWGACISYKEKDNQTYLTQSILKYKIHLFVNWFARSFSKKMFIWLMIYHII